MCGKHMETREKGEVCDAARWMFTSEVRCKSVRLAVHGLWRVIKGAERETAQARRKEGGKCVRFERWEPAAGAAERGV